MVKRSGTHYICARCGSAYPSKEEAESCEARHDLMQRWQEGKIDDLAVAQGLGLPTGTPEEQAVSLRSVANLLQKGADTSLKASTMIGAYMREAPPVFKAATKIFSNGAVQVPAEIRGIWGVKDGDFLFWYKQGDIFIVAPSQGVSPQHRRPHFTGPARNYPSPP